MDEQKCNILRQKAAAAASTDDYKSAAFYLNQIVKGGVALQELDKPNFELYMRKNLYRLPETWTAPTIKETIENQYLRLKQRWKVNKVVKQYTELIKTFILDINCHTPEDKVFYYRLLGDLCRYAYQWQSREPFNRLRKKAILKIEEQASNFYRQAWTSSFHLPLNNPTRLNFLLNFSLWILESENSVAQASDILISSLKEIEDTNCCVDDCKKEIDAIKYNLKTWDSEWKSTIREGPDVKMILVINVIRFEDENSFRTGAEAETIRVISSFRRVNYCVYPDEFFEKDYWTKDDILLQITLFKSECKRRSAKSSVIYLSSHGADQGIFSSDNQLVTATEVKRALQDGEIHEYDNGVRRPTVVIWESCRESLDEVYPTKLPRFGTKERINTNVVFLYSTELGEISKRNKIHGGYLSTAIANVLNEIGAFDIPIDFFVAKVLDNLESIKGQRGDVYHSCKLPVNNNFVI